MESEKDDKRDVHNNIVFILLEVEHVQDFQFWRVAL